MKVKTTPKEATWRTVDSPHVLTNWRCLLVRSLIPDNQILKKKQSWLWDVLLKVLYIIPLSNFSLPWSSFESLSNPWYLMMEQCDATYVKQEFEYLRSGCFSLDGLTTWTSHGFPYYKSSVYTIQWLLHFYLKDKHQMPKMIATFHSEIIRGWTNS